jgi:hypothetical protein
MSTAQVTPTTGAPVRRAPATATRPRLAAVPVGPAHRSRTPFVTLLCGLMIAGLLALLLLNTALAQDSFALHELQRRSAALTDREQALAQQVSVQESPQELARRAIALGMVPSSNPVFLRLADGRTLGVPERAPAAPAPAPSEAGVSPRPPAAPTATMPTTPRTPTARPPATAQEAR